MINPRQVTDAAQRLGPVEVERITGGLELSEASPESLEQIVIQAARRNRPNEFDVGQTMRERT